METQIILPLAIALLAAIFIALPFFTGGERRGGAWDSPGAEGPREERLRQLASRKDSLLSALKDMEFDYGLGKLSRDDYEDLSAKYRAEAAEVIKEMDEAAARGTTPVRERDIESEIRDHRKIELNEYEDEELEKEILTAREAVWSAKDAGSYCDGCGYPRSPGNAYCPRCGMKLDGDNDDRKAGTV